MRRPANLDRAIQFWQSIFGIPSSSRSKPRCVALMRVDDDSMRGGWSGSLYAKSAAIVSSASLANAMALLLFPHFWLGTDEAISTDPAEHRHDWTAAHLLSTLPPPSNTTPSCYCLKSLSCVPVSPPSRNGHGLGTRPTWKPQLCWLVCSSACVVCEWNSFREVNHQHTHPIRLGWPYHDSGLRYPALLYP